MPALEQTAIIGVIGAGAMGAGIAQVAAQAGHPVRLYDNREGAAQAGIADIRQQLETRVALAKLPEEVRGYGPVREATAKRAAARRARLLEELRTGPVESSFNTA